MATESLQRILLNHYTVGKFDRSSRTYTFVLSSVSSSPSSPHLLYEFIFMISPYLYHVCVGKRYLPRKFKVAVTVPGDNSVDLYINDIGLVVITNDKGELEVGVLRDV